MSATPAHVLNPDGTKTPIGYVSTNGLQMTPSSPTDPERITVVIEVTIEAAIADLRLLAEAITRCEKAARKATEKMAENTNRLPPPNRQHGPQQRRQIPPRKIGLHRTSYQR